LAHHLRNAGHQPALDPALASQTNGKVNRFHRTLLEEWAYHRPYACDAERQAVFGDWLDWYKPPPAPHRHRGPDAGRPRHQPVRTAQLAR